MLPSPNPLPGGQESFAKRKDRLWKGTLHSAASVQNDRKGRRSMCVILSAAKNLFPQTPAKVVMQRSPGKRLSIFSILAPKRAKSCSLACTAVPKTEEICSLGKGERSEGR